MQISPENATIISSIISACATILAAIIASRVVSKAITSIQITNIENRSITQNSNNRAPSTNRDKK